MVNGEKKSALVSNEKAKHCQMLRSMALSDSLFKHVDDTDNSRLDVININIFLEYFLQVSYEILPQAAKT